ncbi:hypothetical protein CR513_11650, partial [Mucuna pruriens]
MEERKGRTSSLFTRGMIQFKNFVQGCKLIDASFQVGCFEGENGQDYNKLLVVACVYHLALLKSNHTLLQSNLRGNRCRRPLKFMAAWLRHDYSQIIFLIVGWSNNTMNLQILYDGKQVFRDILRKKCIILRRLNRIASRIPLYDRESFPSLPFNNREDLVNMVSLEEVKRIIFNIGAFKVPNLDGLQVVFYQSQWTVVENSLAKLMINLFANLNKVEEINDTFIALIPKIDRVHNMKNFRPNLVHSTYQ